MEFYIAIVVNVPIIFSMMAFSAPKQPVKAAGESGPSLLHWK